MIPFIYKAKVLKVVDGDTIDCQIELGFNISHKIRFRLYGIDTPEKTAKDADNKSLAFAATDFLRNMIENKEVILRTYKPDKYGRYLCEVLYNNEIINIRMIVEGYAKEYLGDSKVALWNK